MCAPSVACGMLSAILRNLSTPVCLRRIAKLLRRQRLLDRLAKLRRAGLDLGIEELCGLAVAADHVLAEVPSRQLVRLRLEHLVDLALRLAGLEAEFLEERERHVILARAELADLIGRARLLLAEVDTLPEPYREVILLYYYDDVTHQDVAAALGVSAATVNARLTKARAMLRERLSGMQR